MYIIFILPENFQLGPTVFPSNLLSTLSFYCYLWGGKDYLSLLFSFLVSCVISVLGKVKCCLRWKGDNCRSVMQFYLSTWVLELSHFTAFTTVSDYLNKSQLIGENSMVMLWTRHQKTITHFDFQLSCVGVNIQLMCVNSACYLYFFSYLHTNLSLKVTW